MKTYDTIQMLRRLAFGATLLTATAEKTLSADSSSAMSSRVTLRIW